MSLQCVHGCPVILYEYHVLPCLQQTLCELVGSAQWGDVEEVPGQRIIALEASSEKVFTK